MSYHNFFHQVTEEALCIKVTALRESIVGKVQPASVRVFSHYNPRKNLFLYIQLQIYWCKSLSGYYNIKDFILKTE